MSLSATLEPVVGAALAPALSQIGGVPQWAAGTDYWQDFTVPRGNLPAVADTHAATIYEPNAAGVYLPFGANVLTRTDLGLQTVPTRTNSIRNNSNIGGSAPSTMPNNWSKSNFLGVTPTFAYGTENGLPYMDLIVSGTTGDAAGGAIFTEGVVNIVCANGDVWTHSLFAKLVAGSFANVTGIYRYMDYYSSAPAYLGGEYGDGGFTPTSTMQRFSRTFTVSQASIASQQPYIRFAWGAGVAINFTMRVYAYQVEKAAYASPPILTTGAAATVNGNQQVVDLTGKLGSGGSFQIKANVLALNDGDWLWQDNDGTVSNRAGIRQNAGQFQFLVDAGAVNQVALNLGAVSTGVKTFAASYGTNYGMAQLVGGTPPSAQTTVTLPAMSKENFVGNGYNATNNGYAYTQRVARKFGAQNASTFAAALALATVM